MDLYLDLDANTMNVVEKDKPLTKQSPIKVTVTLDADIRSQSVRDRITKLWEDLDPLRDQIENVLLYTTEGNVAYIKPLTWMFPLPLTPVVR